METVQNIGSSRVYSADEPVQTRAFVHIPALDGLRGIAVLAVMGHHLEMFMPGKRPLISGGYLGVDVFFVLSGFLITSVLLNEAGKCGTISLRNFYLRRVMRLVPAYWLFLTTLFLFGGWMLTPYESSVIYDGKRFVAALLYFTNWNSAAGDIAGNLNHTWSLAIEEQFYILWPPILALAIYRKWTRSSILLLTVSIVGLLILIRGARFLSGASTEVLYYSTESRIDAILIGCIASMIYMWKLVPQAQFRSQAFSVVAAAAFALSAYIIIVSGYYETQFLSALVPVFTVCIGVIIVWMTLGKSERLAAPLNNPVLRWIGKISYGLYLWHFLMFQFCLKIFGEGLIGMTLGLAMAIGASTASYYFLELKFLRIKSSFASR